MTVVQADGNDVEPVAVDEFRIGAAETYDVIVRPRADRAYTIFAQAEDRSGYARGTLAPRPGMAAAIPPLDPRAAAHAWPTWAWATWAAWPMAAWRMAGSAHARHGSWSDAGDDGMDHSSMPAWRSGSGMPTNGMPATAIKLKGRSRSTTSR